MIESPIPSTMPVEERVNARTITFLNLLRGAAVLFVVYDHLGAIWPEANGRSWIANRVIRRWVNEPLGIIQDFGFFGVAIFFLISGFIITHVAQRESRFDFAMKRVLRIYPPLIVSIVLILLVALIQDQPIFGFVDYVKASLLLNYFDERPLAVSGVAWTLVVEMLFYAAVFLLLPLLKKRPQVAVAVLISSIAVIIWQCREFGATFFQAAVSIAFLPYLVLGQLVYLRWVRRITSVEYAVLTAATYLVAVFGIRRIHTAFLPANNSYMISVGFAFAVFLGALAFEGSIRVPKAISFTSDISYSLYLMHGIIGFYTLDVLVGRVPFTLAVVIAFALGIGLATLSYRFVEKPSQRAARWVIAKRRSG